MKKLYAFLLCCCCTFHGFSQGIALGPTGNGGFEIGTTLASNGWSTAMSAFNQWAVGTGSVYNGTQGAYIGDATSFVGVNAPTGNHMYRDIAIPATATNVQLSFKYKQPLADANFDSFYVSTTATTNTPVIGSGVGAGYTKWYVNTATAYSTYIGVGPFNLSGLAGTTTRLVFTYKADGSDPIAIPAIDSISLTCTLPAVTGVATLCRGGTTTLSHVTTGGVWSSSNTGIATVTGGVVSGVAAGNATISYTLGSFSVLRIVTVSAPAAHNVTGGGAVCSGGNAAIGLDGSDLGVTYSLSDGTSTVATAGGTGSAISFGSFSGIATYTVSATITSSGCTAAMSGSASITTATPSTPSVSVAADVTAACAGTVVNFTATSVNEGPSATYQWYVNGGPVGAGTTAYSYTPAAGDVVSIALYPGGICSSLDSANDDLTVGITANVMPAVSIASNMASPSCLGRPVTLTAVPVNGGSAPAYLWTKNGVNVATGPAFLFTPASGDVIACTMTSNYACRLATDVTSPNMTMVTQTGVAAPSVNLSATPGNTIMPGQADTIVALASGGTPLVSYSWYINGSPVAGATTSVFISSSLANGDIVTCKVANTDGCANSTLKSMTINVSVLGASLVAMQHNCAIYPSPNNGSFVVTGSFDGASGEDASLTITNMLGQIVYTAKSGITNGRLDKEISLPDVASGMYTLRIHTGAAHTIVRFVITQ